MYAAVMTRPDIAYAVSQLSKHLHNPSEDHQLAADSVLHYLKRQRHLGLKPGGGLTLEPHTDASFGDDPEDRKSSQGFVISLCNGLGPGRP